MKPIEDAFGPPSAEEKAYVKRLTDKWSFHSETMAELLKRPEPQLEWMIESIWVDKARGLIAGHPGVGKTWLALDMLISVSSGQLCLGKYKPNVVGGVLLIEEEASILNLARRVHSMARGRGISDAAMNNFHHVTRQFLKIPKHEKEVIAFIKAKDIKFVVFDSLRRFHNAKENSSDEMQPVLESFARINVETGASVLLIHHLSKGGDQMGAKKSIFERMRGTSDLWAWRDCILGMEGEEEAETATCSFQFRDAESPSPIQVKRCVGVMSGTVRLEAVAVEESPEFLAKCDAAKAHLVLQFGAAFLTDIAKALEGRKSDNLKAVKLMAKMGVLVPLEGGKYGVPK